MERNYYISDDYNEGWNWGKDRAIIETKKPNTINKLTSVVLDALREDKAITQLEELHDVINKSEINKGRIRAYNQINKIDNLKRLILELISPEIFFMLGTDLAIQRKLNISIQMPEDETSILSAHQDYRSGESPFQRVIWIPLTDAFDSNAMYINNESGVYEPINIKRGEILIFDPNTMHGNVLNKTQKTRVSLNIRIKNWFSPDLGDFIPDRQFGEQYEDLCFSHATINAFKMLSELKENKR